MGEWSPTVTKFKYRIDSDPGNFSMEWTRPTLYGTYKMPSIIRYDFGFQASFKDYIYNETVYEWHIAGANASVVSCRYGIPEFMMRDRKVLNIRPFMRTVYYDTSLRVQYSWPEYAGNQFWRPWSYEWESRQIPTDFTIGGQDDVPTDTIWIFPDYQPLNNLNTAPTANKQNAYYVSKYKVPSRNDGADNEPLHYPGYVHHYFYNPTTQRYEDSGNNTETALDNTRTWHLSRQQLKDQDWIPDKAWGDNSATSYPSQYAYIAQKNEATTLDSNFSDKSFKSNWGTALGARCRPAHKPIVSSVISGYSTARIKPAQNGYTCDKIKGVGHTITQWYYSLDGGTYKTFTPDADGYLNLEGLACGTHTIRLYYKWKWNGSSHSMNSYKSSTHNFKINKNPGNPTFKFTGGADNYDMSLCEDEVAIEILEPIGDCGNDYIPYGWEYRIDSGSWTDDWAIDPYKLPTSPTLEEKWTATIKTNEINTLGDHTVNVRGTLPGNTTKSTPTQTLTLEVPDPSDFCAYYDTGSPTSEATIYMNTDYCEPYLVGRKILYRTRFAGTNAWSDDQYIAFYSVYDDTNPKQLVFDVEENVEYKFDATSIYKRDGKNNSNIIESKTSDTLNSECKITIDGDTSLEPSIFYYDTKILSEYPHSYWNSKLPPSIKVEAGKLSEKYYQSLTENSAKIYYSTKDFTDSLPIVFGAEKNFAADLSKPSTPKNIFRLDKAPLVGIGVRSQQVTKNVLRNSINNAPYAP